MTHGPAMSTSGEPPPIVSPPNLIASNAAYPTTVAAS
jgi:hypothetical protein